MGGYIRAYMHTCIRAYMHACMHTQAHRQAGASSDRMKDNSLTWKDMRPGRKTFSPVSGWNAESYMCFAAHT